MDFHFCLLLAFCLLFGGGLFSGVIMKRAAWGSRLGFIFAVAGSAIGLANIWKFPYTVGKFGGAAFIAVYLLSLLLIGFPVLMSEILIGRRTHLNPSGAFKQLGGPRWAYAGKATIATGFIVSAFYSAVAGWILGYLVEALRGNVSSFQSVAEASAYHSSLLQHPLWGIGYHLAFVLLAVGVLYLGVREGIERCCKVMMPLLFVLLIALVIKGLTMSHASEALHYLFAPDWSSLTPLAMLTAVGQSFFTLSLGQGTMVTYGSYLKGRENLLQSCVPVVLMDTCVSLLAAVAVFTIVFSVGMHPDSGPGLVFHTLPLAFSQIPGGMVLAVLFFLLVTVAALTSEISAMEPTIAYLMDERRWSRHRAVAVVGLGAFLVGVPCALSTSVLSHVTVFGWTIMELFDHLTTNVMIPLGGLAAVVLVSRVWGIDRAFNHFCLGLSPALAQSRAFKDYFWFCFKYTAPVLILLVFIGAFLF